MIKDIVNILIPYPNYGFCQRAADPSNPSDSLELPRPTPVGARPLEDALAFDVLSHGGPPVLHVARLDDLKKRDVIGLHRVQMLQQPRQRTAGRAARAMFSVMDPIRTAILVPITDRLGPAAVERV